MKREKVLLSGRRSGGGCSVSSQLPVLKPVGKLNPAPSESNQETLVYPQEEKETITMKDDSMPSIETSFFSGLSEQDAAEAALIDWTKTKAARRGAASHEGFGQEIPVFDPRCRWTRRIGFPPPKTTNTTVT